MEMEMEEECAAEETELEYEEEEDEDEESRKKKKKIKKVKPKKLKQRHLDALAKVDMKSVSRKVKVAVKVVMAIKKFQGERDIMTQDLRYELRKNKLKEFAGIVYEAGELIYSMFA